MKRWAAAVVLLTSCTAAIPRPTLLHAQRANLELSSLENGRSLFLSHCGNCHLTPAPNSHTVDAWAKFVPEMSKDAKLNEAETAQVLAFVQLFASNGSAALPDADGQGRQPNPQ